MAKQVGPSGEVVLSDINAAMLENGRRQIINFAVPGDFLGLRGGLVWTLVPRKHLEA